MLHINVRGLTGNEINVDVRPEGLVFDIQEEIQKKEGIRTDLQILLFGNKPLQGDQVLSDCGIVDKSTLYLNLRASDKSDIVAGGYELGEGANQFAFPYGIFVVDDQTIIVADWGNHRIVQWKMGEKEGKVIAGGHGPGNGLHQLNCPTDVLIETERKILIIADHGNRRVVQWTLGDNIEQGELLLENIGCWGLALNSHRLLYVSDVEKHQVIQYDFASKAVTRVAGGHGKGCCFNQLNVPTYLFVDDNEFLYISDTWNNRVMKWKKGDTVTGEIVAAGAARGLFVDKDETVYLADYGGHKIISWPKGANEGIFYKASNRSAKTKQLYRPWGLANFQGRFIYAADHSGQRIQRFPIAQA